MALEIVEHINDSGRLIPFERQKTTLPLAKITEGEKIKGYCESCSSYGKNHSCPPHSPEFLNYVEGCNRVNVICLSVSSGVYDLPTAEERYRAGFREAGKLLLGELMAKREEGFVVAGSGPCLACTPCTLEEDDEACRYPEKRVYSLESLGVDVTALIKSCFDFDLEWSDDEKGPGRVCAVGGFFLTETT